MLCPICQLSVSPAVPCDTAIGSCVHDAGCADDNDLEQITAPGLQTFLDSTIAIWALAGMVVRMVTKEVLVHHMDASPRPLHT